MNDDELRRRIHAADPAKNYVNTLGENFIMENIPQEKPKKKPTFTPQLAFATASTLVVAGLFGVSTLSNLNPGPQNPLLTISADGGSNQSVIPGAAEENATSDSAKSDMIWRQPYNYIYLPGDTLSREAGNSYGYKMVLPQNPEQFLNNIARALEMDSTRIERNPDEYMQDYYVIGDYLNYSGEVLGYWHNGAGYWNYSNNSAYSNVEQYPEECLISEREIIGDTSVEEEKVLPSQECLDWRPTPPADLPSNDEAIDYANKLFSKIYGEKFDFQVYRDDYSVNLTATQKVDGVNAGLSLGVSWYGSIVSYAYGFSANAEKIEGLKLISPYDAVSRADDYRWWGYSWENDIAYPIASESGAASSDSGEAITEKPAVEPREQEGSSDSIDGGEVEPGIPDMTGVPEDYEVEDKEVILVDSTLKLLVVYAADGSMWLLPGYVYKTNEELLYTQAPSIIAVDESLIRLG